MAGKLLSAPGKTEGLGQLFEEGGPREMWGRFLGAFFEYLPTLLTGLIFAATATLLTFFIVFLVKRGLKRSKMEKALHYFVSSLVKYTLLVLIIISTLGLLGVPLTPILTALGTVGLALSLALRDNLTNVAGGFFLLFNCPFRTGDYIELKNVAGTVTRISMTYTILRTNYNRNIFIPNGDFSKTTITNYSMGENRCMELEFTVKPAAGNIDAAKKIIMSALEKSGATLPEPPPAVRVNEHTPAAVKLTCIAWVEPKGLYDLKAFVIQQVMEELAEKGML